MKICQVVSHYVPAYHYGGVLHVAHSLSKALTAQGHTVHVCTTNLNDPTHDLSIPVDSPVLVDKATVYYEPTQVSRYWGFSLPMIRRVWKETAWADVVLIHFHYQFASLVGSWACRLGCKPYIPFTHGSLNQFGVSGRSTLRKRLYLTLLERSNFRKALFVAYQSQEEMDNSYKFGRCQVVPNGIDPEMFVALPPKGYFRERYPELKGRTIYLYLGRLDAGKGLDLLLPAFGELVSKRGDVHLVLAGGEERGYEVVVQEIISQRGLSGRVTLTGLVSGPDKLGLLQDADVYVLPSRSEGLSIAMLEAMYMGLPVVVTDRVGLWRQVEKQRCGLVVSLDQKQMAKALHQMLVAPDRGDMGRRGHEMVSSHHTWDVIARNLMAQIQELVTFGRD